MSVGDEGFTFAHSKVCKGISFTPCMKSFNSESWCGVYVGIHLTDSCLRFIPVCCCWVGLVEVGRGISKCNDFMTINKFKFLFNIYLDRNTC